MKQQSHSPFLLFLLFGAVLATILAGCVELSSSNFSSGSQIELREALKDKGAMRVDPSNPYLAAAQLLNAEKKVSESLNGFLSIRGEPAAIEIEKDKSSRFLLKLYYTDLFERYELTSTESDWVIAGPFPDQSVPRSFTGQETPVPTKPTAAPTTAVKYWGSTPTPKAEPTDIPVPTIVEPAEPTVAVVPATTPVTSETTLAPATNNSGNYAELSPRGDVVHYVTLPGETISIISRWYTGERDNASKIARLNRMKNADTLQIGDSIVIPSYMVRNKERLTESGLAKVQSSIATEK